MHGLLLAAGLLSLPLHVLAHPQPSTSTSLAGRAGAVDLNEFRIAHRSSYTSHDEMKKLPSIASFRQGTYLEVATELVKQTMPNMEFRLVDDHYVGDSGIGHVRFRQTMHGIDIDNSDFNVNVRY